MSCPGNADCNKTAAKIAGKRNAPAKVDVQAVKKATSQGFPPIKRSSKATTRTSKVKIIRNGKVIS